MSDKREPGRPTALTPGTSQLPAGLLPGLARRECPACELLFQNQQWKNGRPPQCRKHFEESALAEIEFLHERLEKVLRAATWIDMSPQAGMWLCAPGPMYLGRIVEAGDGIPPWVGWQWMADPDNAWVFLDRAEAGYVETFAPLWFQEAPSSVESPKPEAHHPPSDEPW